MAENSLQTMVTEQNGAVIVAVRGEIDLNTSPDMRKVLQEHVSAHRNVVVDLSGVEYIDSSGIAGLVEGHQIARRGEGAFILAAPSMAVTRVLGLARLDKVFTIADSRDDALAGFG